MYASDIVAVHFLVVAPLTVVMYITLSLIFKKQVIENDDRMRVLERADLEADAESETESDTSGANQ